MRLVEEACALIKEGTIKEMSKNLLEDSIGAILGDPIAVGKIIVAIGRSPFFIREQLFWAKLRAYLDGVYLEEDDKGKLRAKLLEVGEKDESIQRLIQCIDGAETQKKIDYIVNATRCLLADFIDKPTFFRVCHAITHTLEEDLAYLSVHIDDVDLLYNVNVQGLLTTGLMYQSVIDADGEPKYSFTSIAKIVDQYAVSYANEARYPNPLALNQDFSSPQQQIVNTVEWKEISNEEIDGMVFDDR